MRWMQFSFSPTKSVVNKWEKQRSEELKLSLIEVSSSWRVCGEGGEHFCVVCKRRHNNFILFNVASRQIQSRESKHFAQCHVESRFELLSALGDVACEALKVLSKKKLFSSFCSFFCVFWRRFRWICDSMNVSNLCEKGRAGEGK